MNELWDYLKELAEPALKVMVVAVVIILMISALDRHRRTPPDPRGPAPDEDGADEPPGPAR